jgi:hypothetical protein
MQIERFCMELLSNFIIKNHDEIQRDYNETSFLYSFWQNYPPEDRGRQPKGDPFSWIEVGEHVFCLKLSRFIASSIRIRDASIPTGHDDRYIISSEKIRSILKITVSRQATKRHIPRTKPKQYRWGLHRQGIPSVERTKAVGRQTKPQA